MARPTQSRTLSQVGWTGLVALLLAMVTRGPVYRIRLDAAEIRGDFVDDRWVQGAFVVVYLLIIVLSVPTFRANWSATWKWIASCISLPAVLLVASLWSVDRSRAADQSVLLMFGTLAAIGVGLRLGIRQFLLGAIIGIQLVVGAGVLAVLRQWPLSVDSNDRWAGVFFNRNSFAAPAAVGLLLVVVFAVEVARSRTWRRPVGLTALAGLAAMDLAVLARTQSLTPVFGVALGAVVLVTGRLAVRRFVPRDRGWIVPALIVVAVVGLVWRALLAVRSSAGRLGRSPTLEGRTYIWRVVRDFIEDRPLFGSGLNAVWTQSDIHYALLNFGGGYDVNEAHSGYYEVLLAGGVVALVALVVCLVAALRIALVAVVVLRRPLADVALFSVGYIVAVNMTESYVGANLMPWTMFLAVTSASLLDVVREGQRSTLDGREPLTRTTESQAAQDSMSRSR